MNGTFCRRTVSEYVLWFDNTFLLTKIYSTQERKSGSMYKTIFISLFYETSNVTKMLLSFSFSEWIVTAVLEVQTFIFTFPNIIKTCENSPRICNSLNNGYKHYHL